MRQLQIRVVTGCLALAELALRPDTPLVTRDMQVRIDTASPWLAVHSSAFNAEPQNPRLDTLLPPTELAVARLAKWIELNDRLDVLGWAVARRMLVSVQAQVQVLTSLVEGIHRRIPETFTQKRFPKARDAALTRVRKAAAAAKERTNREEGLKPELVYESVKNAVGHINDVSYRERADAVVERVGAAISELVEIESRLGARLTESRHSFAHQLPQDAQKTSLEDRVGHWIVVARVKPWLLRALLLLEVGVAPDLLRQKVLENESFAFERVNAEVRVRQLGWELAARTLTPKTPTDHGSTAEASSSGAGDWVVQLTYGCNPSVETLDEWEDQLSDLDAVITYQHGVGLKVTAYADSALTIPGVVDSVEPLVRTVVGQQPCAVTVTRQQPESTE